MLELILFLIIFILSAFVFFLFKKSKNLEEQLSELEFRKGSQSVKYGLLSQQWIPFSQNFPYNAENFRFIGNPIDGIAFEEDKIVLCEFKASNSQLSEKQKKIKELIESKKVEWLEFKIK